jgi:hypothetical protein
MLCSNDIDDLTELAFTFYTTLTALEHPRRVSAENVICAVLHYSALEHGLELDGVTVVTPHAKIRALLPANGSFDATAGANLSAGIELISKHLTALSKVSRASMAVDRGTPLSATRRHI